MCEGKSIPEAIIVPRLTEQTRQMIAVGEAISPLNGNPSARLQYYAPRIPQIENDARDADFALLELHYPFRRGK